jgi:hypothetical protein
MRRKKVDRESCKSCRFCRSNECHKNPPGMTWPIYESTGSDYHIGAKWRINTSQDPVSEWPPVKDDDWCGEYQRRSGGDE